MSAFDGHLLEYPFVSIDRFDGSNLSSEVYFLSHCHKDHVVGLLDEMFLHRLKSGFPDVKLYASETTRNLMLCDPEMQYVVEYAIGLPVHQQTFISIKNGESKKETIVVTPISAGHCVGSVMFLFEGGKGTVLYTGDFRLGEKEISKVPALHCGLNVRCLKSMYVDTTFCCPKVPSLPTRGETKASLIKIISMWILKGPNYMVHLKCKGRYGYEYIMKEVAKHFMMKIHVNHWRMKMCAKLNDMLKHFTTDASSTQIHCCYYGKISTNSACHLPCDLQYINGERIKMITIVPSSLYFLKDGIPKENHVWIQSQKLWRVVHSMHASYNEIREVVGYLKPQNIYPCVPPVDCQDILKAYERLQDLRQTSDSQDSDLVDEKLKEEISEEKISWTANLQSKNLLSPRSASRHHRSLGIEKIRNLTSPPPRRKRRRRQLTTSNEVNKKEHLSEIKEIVVEDENTDTLLDQTFGKIYEEKCTQDSSGEDLTATIIEGKRSNKFIIKRGSVPSNDAAVINNFQQISQICDKESSHNSDTILYDIR